MKKYELGYLISADIEEKEIKSLSEKISALIKEKGGLLDAFSLTTKKKLFYPIKNNDAANFQSLNFSLEPENLKSLEQSLRAEKNILRFTLVHKKPMKLKERKSRLLRKTPHVPILKKLEKKEKTEEKVELKELDKKLEEILGE